jgi:ComF family protein
LHTWPLREAIHALKYENCPELAQPLARYLIASYQSDDWQQISDSIEAVVPVPLHHERAVERGYNQSELLASEFCTAANLTLETQWLQRTKPTRQQVGLNPQERRDNVQDAFTAHGSVYGRTLLLIDDVYTTGATMEACAQAAMAAGATRVFTLTLAIPVRN